MNSVILQCCENNPKFLITYKIGSKFYVCNSCIRSGCWSRGVQEKIPVSETDDPGRSHSISEQELVNSG